MTKQLRFEPGNGEKLKVYLIGSLRNPALPETANYLRERDFDIFDDWFAAGPEADDMWQSYEKQRGRTYGEALAGAAARNVFAFDLRHISEAHVGVLMLPAGKSGHLELGYMAGQGKPTIIYFSEGEPERWDVMYQFATKVVFSAEQLYFALGDIEQGVA